MQQSDTPQKTLTGRKVKAIKALLSYDTIDEASKAVKISRSTMYRYFNDPLFVKELRVAKRQMVNRAIMRLQQTCGDATTALAEICRDKEAPPSSRITAAKEILNQSIKAIELEEIEQRITILEKEFSQMPKKKEIRK